MVSINLGIDPNISFATYQILSICLFLFLSTRLYCYHSGRLSTYQKCAIPILLLSPIGIIGLFSTPSAFFGLLFVFIASMPSNLRITSRLSLSLIGLLFHWSALVVVGYFAFIYTLDRFFYPKKVLVFLSIFIYPFISLFLLYASGYKFVEGTSEIGYLSTIVLVILSTMCLLNSLLDSKSSLYYLGFVLCLCLISVFSFKTANRLLIPFSAFSLLLPSTIFNSRVFIASAFLIFTTISLFYQPSSFIIKNIGFSSL